MAKNRNVSIEYNEWIAIAGALSMQVDNINEILSDPSLDFVERAQLQADLHSTESALSKIMSMLEDNRS